MQKCLEGDFGFTGGTVDKLESIPGYITDISIDKFIENVKDIGISLIGQTANLAPADKKLYALRDTINCVDNMSLIASSIMSKKIAAGANKIVLDVTVGSGAFMKTKEDAEKLSNTMKEIGKLSNRETICILTNMKEPVGHMVGNSLEIKEVVKCLKGELPEDIKEIITTIGAYIIKLSGKSDNLEENKKMILENITNGKAYSKFCELVKNQGGDISYIEDINKFENARVILPIKATKTGVIEELNAETVGNISVDLGAGRVKKEDGIDMAVGIELNKKIGDKVESGDILGYIYANDEEKGKTAVKAMGETYKISDKTVQKETVILEII